MISRIYSAAQDLHAAAPTVRWPCCEWVADVCLRATGLDGEHDYRRGSRWWQSANIWHPAEPWSSVYAADELRRVASWPGSYVRRVVALDPEHRAREIGAGLVAGGWHVMQGWSTLPDPGAGIAGSGHTWLWWCDPGDPGVGVCVESSVARGVRTSGIPGVPMWSVSQRMALVERCRRYTAGVGYVLVEPPTVGE